MSESAGAPLATSLERAAEHAEERIDALLGRQSALAAPRATGRILLAAATRSRLGMLMGSDPVGVLTGSVLGALTGLLGLGLAFAGAAGPPRSCIGGGGEHKAEHQGGEC